MVFLGRDSYAAPDYWSRILSSAICFIAPRQVWSAPSRMPADTVNRLQKSLLQNSHKQKRSLSLSGQIFLFNLDFYYVLGSPFMMSLQTRKGWCYTLSNAATKRPPFVRWNGRKAESTEKDKGILADSLVCCVHDSTFHCACKYRSRSRYKMKYTGRGSVFLFMILPDHVRSVPDEGSFLLGIDCYPVFCGFPHHKRFQFLHALLLLPVGKVYI